MTDLKTEEFLLELPSKRLINRFVLRFPDREDLVDQLFTHFRVVRDTGRVADALVNWLVGHVFQTHTSIQNGCVLCFFITNVTTRCKSDFEFGLLKDRSAEFMRKQDFNLQV
jgi:hypothetical protein